MAGRQNKEAREIGPYLRKAWKHLQRREGPIKARDITERARELRHEDQQVQAAEGQARNRGRK